MKTKTRKMETISLCGDAMGHRPLRGPCPKMTDEERKKIVDNQRGINRDRTENQDRHKNRDRDRESQLVSSRSHFPCICSPRKERSQRAASNRNEEVEARKKRSGGGVGTVAGGGRREEEKGKKNPE